jgi:hypothetical protein
MPALRSVVSVLVRFVVRSFSTNSRPALRAAASGGRPRAGTDTTVAQRPASPNAASADPLEVPGISGRYPTGPWTHGALASALGVDVLCPLTVFPSADRTHRENELPPSGRGSRHIS